MRLGGPVFDAPATPAEWIRSLQKLGYRAAYCPVGADADDAKVAAYARAADGEDIVIAEVGAWSNPISPVAEERQAAIATCRRQLELAERIGARCCVNIAGSRNPTRWDGPHPDNLSEATFELIVTSVRDLLDEVKPARTTYTLETMPWIFPDSAESYHRLIKAIDRPQFAVHLDPVNLVNCPSRAFDTASLLRRCFELLGPHIKSCHAKDITLSEQLTVHLDECRPGTGRLDYAVYLECAEACDPDLPIMLEHLPTAEDYRLAAEYVRSVAAGLPGQ